MKYRLYKLLNEQKWWITDRSNGECFCSIWRERAALFTELDWLQWAEAEGLEREQVAEVQAMRLIDAPMLPGLGGEDE